jgi:hypothetical protein
LPPADISGTAKSSPSGKEDPNTKAGAANRQIARYEYKDGEKWRIDEKKRNKRKLFISSYKMYRKTIPTSK